MQINGTYDFLANSEGNEDKPSRPAAFTLEAALETVKGIPKDLPLSEAWKPCKAIPFERDIDMLTDEELEQGSMNLLQANSSNPDTILGNLHKYRLRYLDAKAKISSATHLSHIEGNVEALRKKTCLLFRQSLKAAGQQRIKVRCQAGGDACRRCLTTHGLLLPVLTACRV